MCEYEVNAVLDKHQIQPARISQGAFDTIAYLRAKRFRIAGAAHFGCINLDTTGLDALEKLHAVLIKHGGHLIVAGATEQSLSLMKCGGFITPLGENKVVDSLQDALSVAHERTAPAMAAT